MYLNCQNTKKGVEVFKLSMYEDNLAYKHLKIHIPLVNLTKKEKIK